MNTNLTIGLFFGALTVLGCSGGGGSNDKDTALASKDGGAVAQEQSTACTDARTSCTNGALTTCQDGVTKTISCEEQCKADGFEPANKCSPKDSTRCGCGSTTDAACTAGIDAWCTCLESSPACQGFAILDAYARCHRDPSSETATILKCFSGYKSGDQVACNTAITKCGDTVPSTACTADADCDHCERCERSTGKCLAKLACN